VEIACGTIAIPVENSSAIEISISNSKSRRELGTLLYPYSRAFSPV